MFLALPLGAGTARYWLISAGVFQRTQSRRSRNRWIQSSQISEHIEEGLGMEISRLTMLPASRSQQLTQRLLTAPMGIQIPPAHARQRGRRRMRKACWPLRAGDLVEGDGEEQVGRDVSLRSA